MENYKISSDLSKERVKEIFRIVVGGYWENSYFEESGDNLVVYKDYYSKESIIVGETESNQDCRIVLDLNESGIVDVGVADMGRFREFLTEFGNMVYES